MKTGKPFTKHLPRGKRTPSRFNASKHVRRLKKTWGNRIFSAAEVKAMREAELKGEHG